MRVAPPVYRHAAEPRCIARFALAFCLSCLVASPSHAAQELSPLPQLASEGVLDRSSEGLVQASWVLPSQPIYPGQRVALELAITIDESLLANHMVQPFTRRLDVPVALDEPLITGLDSGEFGPADPDADNVRIAFGDRVLRATQHKSSTAGGRALSLQTYVQAAQPGSFELPAPIVRFGFADEFRDDVLGRVPVGARLALSRGASSQLVVSPFPEGGRQPDFSGAIGRFEVTADASSAVVRIGDVVHLSVEVEGELPESNDVLPRLDRWRGLHLSSQRVRRHSGGATIEAELRVERATVRQIPAIELHSFDPTNASYLVARSRSIPLRVITGADLAPAEEAHGRSSRWMLWPLLGAGLGLAILFYRRSRAR